MSWPLIAGNKKLNKNHIRILFMSIRVIKKDLTRMLSFPWKREETSFMSISLCCGTDTSQIEPVTSKPKWFQSLRHLLRSFTCLAQVWTLAPKPVNSSTMACLFIHYTIQNHKLIEKRKGFMIEESTRIKVENFVPNSASSTSDKSCHAV